MTLKQQMEIVRALGFAAGVLESISKAHPQEKEAAAEAIIRLDAASVSVREEPVTP